MDLRKAIGKTVKSITVAEDFDQRDIDLEFTDGTFLHIGVTPKIEVVARFEAPEAVLTA